MGNERLSSRSVICGRCEQTNSLTIAAPDDEVTMNCSKCGQPLRVGFGGPAE